MYFVYTFFGTLCSCRTLHYIRYLKEYMILCTQTRFERSHAALSKGVKRFETEIVWQLLANLPHVELKNNFFLHF